MENKEVVLILENMRSDFRAFKEGLNLLNAKFEDFVIETRGMNKFLQDMMYEHEKFMAEHEQWLRDHNVKISDHEGRIKKLETKAA